MPTVTVPRDVSSKEIAKALTSRLGSRYHVLEGKSVGWGFGVPHDADEAHIVVASGSGRFLRTQVWSRRDGDRTLIKVETPGPVGLWVVNIMHITRKVHQALADSLRAS